MEQQGGNVDVEAIMARIRAEVKSLVERGDFKVETFVPTKAKLSETTPLLYTEELNYLNRNWHTWAEPPVIESHRKFIGPVLVRFKRFFGSLLWNSLLRDYFERERSFQMQLVRFLNATARYTDTRIADVFWQLIHKIDHDIGGLSDQMLELNDRGDTTLRAIQASLNEDVRQVALRGDELSRRQQQAEATLAEVERVTRGLERTVALFAKSGGGAAEGLPPPALGKSGVDYLLLENRYRGSEEEILARQRPYLRLFQDAKAPVLDVGCGRGEFLELLKGAGIPAVGIDLDEAMAARSRDKGFDVRLGDVLSFLESAGDNSFGGLFAAQVVEHMTAEQLAALFRLARAKLVPGARIALETINPNSIVALARNFFRDPTHIWPLHPDTLRFTMEMSGIESEEIIFSAEYPQDSRLQKIETKSYLPGRWLETIEAINGNIERLNGLLFGHQDYCVVGIVRK